jgi:hypothetical protein
MGRHYRSAIVIAVVLSALTAMATPAGAPAQAGDLRPLIELIAPSGQGRLYTLNEREAESAVRDFGFNRLRDPVAWMWPQQMPGTVPVFRLRWTQRSSYLLSGSTEERDRLVARGDFVYEGIVGYAATLAAAPPPGTTALWRYSKDGVWRVVLEADGPQLALQGYKADGRFGYVYASPPAAPPNPEPPSDPNPPPGPPPPLCRGVEGPTVQVNRRSRGIVRFGARAVLSGRVRAADGSPVAGVEVRALTGGRGLAQGQTSRSGAFRLRLPPGPSRTVHLGVAAASPAGSLMCTAVRVRVRAGVRLSVPRVVHGRRIPFSGRLLGRPVPRRGVVVELQAFEAGRWRQFVSVRTTRSGRFRTSYRLQRTRAPRTFRFRARVRAQAPYPYALGTSRPVRARVVP